MTIFFTCYTNNECLVAPDPLTGGTVKVSELRNAAEEACGVPNADQPFACLDLTFIATFLQHGYRFHPTKELMVSGGWEEGGLLGGRGYLTFIATFLQHGYRFHPTKELMVSVKRFDTTHICKLTDICELTAR